jgi:hypothetical protein
MSRKQLLRDNTYIKLVTFVNSKFQQPVKSLEQIEAEAPKIMPLVESFILERLELAEQDTLDFQCPNDLLDFIRSVGASMLPDKVKMEMWMKMQLAMEQQRAIQRFDREERRADSFIPVE